MGFFFILWNPITGKFCKYSDPDNSFDSSSNCRVSWGFGHVSSVVDDYKIVRILELNASMEIRVHVFSLKSNKWKRIELMTKNHPLIAEDPYISLSFYSRQGVLVNKTLYWIVSNTNNWDRKIVAFDLENETFNTVFDMNLVSNDVYRDNFLCVMGGCLSKFGVNIRDDVYINMLKGDGKAESIRLSRDLRLRSCRSFVGFTKNGGFFVLMENSTIGIINPTSQPMNYKFTPLGDQKS
ncbi:F-box protein CPR1 [Bienertia sinuspersici]